MRCVELKDAIGVAAAVGRPPLSFGERGDLLRGLFCDQHACLELVGRVLSKRSTAVQVERAVAHVDHVAIGVLALRHQFARSQPCALLLHVHLVDLDRCCGAHCARVCTKALVVVVFVVSVTATFCGVGVGVGVVAAVIFAGIAGGVAVKRFVLLQPV